MSDAVPKRPPEVVACPDCVPSARCDKHRAPLAVGYQGARHRCPACGAEQNLPNWPRVPGCRPNCPRYGRRSPASGPPIPFAPIPVDMQPTKIKGSGAESGRRWLDATPKIDRVRAWERLERASAAWLQTRDVAVRGTASPLAIRKIEAEMEDAARALAKLRKDKP